MIQDLRILSLPVSLIVMMLLVVTLGGCDGRQCVESSQAPNVGTAIVCTNPNP